MRDRENEREIERLKGRQRDSERLGEIIRKAENDRKTEKGRIGRIIRSRQRERVTDLR